MQCLKIELHAVTAVTAVVTMMMMGSAELYSLIEIKKSSKMIPQGEN